MYVRTEDGATFNTTVSGFPLVGTVSGWHWVRLETGEDVLVGPTVITNVHVKANAREARGDVAPIQVGASS